MITRQSPTRSRDSLRPLSLRSAASCESKIEALEGGEDPLPYRRVEAVEVCRARSPSAAGCQSASTKQRKRRKVRSKKGRAVYARRKAIVEPVFGQIDTVQDGRRLLLRGEPAARDQWSFQCAIHDLSKLHRNGGLGLLSPG